jgi:putative N6-adenine-specific DNA methylase
VRAVEEAGVAFDATPEVLWRANLWLRTASRVLVRLAEFTARSFAELEEQAGHVRWDLVTKKGDGEPRLRVTCRKSRLYHSDAVAERVARAYARRSGGAPGWQAAGEEDEGEGGPLFVVRFLHDRCTISADASGALLHQRGYRQAVGKAPLRETLAAALLLAAGYDGSGPLLDPLCGSGTIAIEAALIARRLAPGRDRHFAFERWPSFAASRWRKLLAEADAGALPAAPAPILASDRDAGAVEATLANAARAGVAGDLTVARQALSDAAPPEGAAAGWLVTNPPYGKRVGDTEALRPLWARLGQLAALRLPGWRLGVLAPDARLEGALNAELGRPLEAALRTTNGGLPVRLLTGRVPG